MRDLGDGGGRAGVLLIGGVLGWVLQSAVGSGAAIAQILPDPTLGTERSQVLPNQPVSGAAADVISGGALRGTNLFHSFSEFQVREGQRVYFANPTGIENILSRITGSNASRILGTLGVDGAANLYLLNPHGILFGPNARLDIRGSFIAGTGDRITFLDGATFPASPLETAPLLTVATPIGLQYGATPAGAIAQQGQLSVGAGQRLSLLGGMVTHSGQLSAPGGRVEVLGDRVALLSNARIDVSAATGGGTVLIGGDFRGQGPVPTAARTWIGPGAAIFADALERGNGGRVAVWAEEATGFYGQIRARGGVQAGDGGFVEVSGRQSLEFQGQVQLGAINGRLGTLLLDPENIRIANVTPPTPTNDAQLPQIFFTVDPGASYLISSAALQSQDAEIILEATNDISIDNGISLTFNASGNPIRFTADADRNGTGSVLMDRTQAIATRGREIRMEGASLALGRIDTSTNAGNGGRITLAANNGSLEVAQVDASSFATDAGGQPTGTGGEISLFATGDINANSLDNAGVVNNIAGNLNGNRISLRSLNGDIRLVGLDGENDSVEGRSIEINTPGDLNITGNLNARTDGPVRAGDIVIGNLAAPRSITLGALSTRNRGGAGGDIRVSTSGTLTSTRFYPRGTTNPVDASLDTFSIGSEAVGGGGTIEISAAAGIQTVAGIVSNSRVFGNGGEITLRSENGGIQIGAGTIDARAGTQGSVFSAGNGGNIAIEAARDITLNGAVLSGTNLSGNAGNIQIVSQQGFIDTTRGILNASSTSEFFVNPVLLPFGNGGNVTLRAAGGNLFSGSIESIGRLGGTITLESGGVLSVLENDIASITTGAGRGGDLRLQGRSLNLTDARIVSLTLEAGRAGNISVVSDQVDMRNRDRNSPATIPNQTLSFENLRSIPAFQGTGLITSTAGAGDSGDITVRTQRLSIRNAASPEANQLTGMATLTFLDTTGNAGALNVQATEFIEIVGSIPGAFVPISNIDTAGRINDIDTGLTSATQGSGQAGSLTITTGRLSIRDGAAASSGNSRTGPGTGAGNTLTVNANQVELQGLAALATATFGSAAAGDLQVTGDRIILRDGALFGADTLGSGPAGQMRITTTDLSLFNGARIGAATAGPGQGGTITIDAGRTILIDGTSGGDTPVRSGIFTNSQSAGAAGNLILNAERITLSNGGSLSTDTSSSGLAGSIELGGSALMILEVLSGSRMGSTTSGSGDGGTITVDADRILLSDGGTLATDASDTGAAGSIELGGSLTTLEVVRNARISATTSGSGDGGTITVNADRILLSDGGTLATDASAAGAAGNIELGDRHLTTLTLLNGARIGATTSGSGAGGRIRVNARQAIALSDAASLAASTSGEGAAGNIRLTTLDLTLLAGSQVAATTSGSGAGGRIRIDATDIALDGVSAAGDRSGILTTAATTRPGQVAGRGGNIVVNGDRLSLSNRAEISVTGFGAGIPGDIEVTASDIFLRQQARIAGQTQAVPGVLGTALEGGNIRLTVARDIRLSNDGNPIPTEITTSAASASRGGRITLRAGRAILGRLGENSDIVADADRGQGGLIDAQAPLIAQFRQYNGERTRQSDFTAASLSGGDGTVDANSDNPQPSLPSQPDLPRILPVCPTSQGITRREAGSSEFFNTGRGGLPPDPAEPLDPNAAAVPWVPLPGEDPAGSGPAGTDPAESGPAESGPAESESAGSGPAESESAGSGPAGTSSPQTRTGPPPVPTVIAEAYGWRRFSNGEVLLTSVTTPTLPPLCPVRGQQ